MKTIVKLFFALTVAIVMLMGALMLYTGARENAARAMLPEAAGDAVIGIIGGADGPTAIFVGGQTR